VELHNIAYNIKASAPSRSRAFRRKLQSHSARITPNRSAWFKLGWPVTCVYRWFNSGRWP